MRDFRDVFGDIDAMFDEYSTERCLGQEEMLKLRKKMLVFERALYDISIPIEPTDKKRGECERFIADIRDIDD